ncbi:ABC transporter permease [Acrocarpospora pleiomorpha]|uniref:ABC transporter permease n=1 Tax=Acrocarpospora pleiomorpha TaxID=90975 RepID=A0A5M3XY16_9ACTN|nr:ABC transporter permease [Acrocarpospora pleiomorpha]GES25776.1 ABC transporter permease [Acrocarpospora pleiomorpha]
MTSVSQAQEVTQAVPPLGGDESAELMDRPPLGGVVLRRLVRKPSAIVSLVVLTVIGLLVVFGLWIAPEDPNAIDLKHKLQRPSADAWLGTDDLGRDILSRVIVATRVDVLAATQAVLIALLVGVALGLVAGYRQGVVDGLVSRVIDALMALPPLILAVVVVGTLGTGLTNAMIAIGIVLVPGIFRLARASTMVAKSELYIEAARASGVPTSRILRRHILPAIVGPLVIQVTFAAAAAIIAEASLTFLGLGAAPPQATWGTMLKDGAQYMGSANYLLIPPALMIMITILSLSKLGDALRDAMGRQSADERGR